jgi:mono/diheme cytochrome c family protein
MRLWIALLVAGYLPALAWGDEAARAWGHPFWGALGRNGTVCVTCHQSDPYATLEGTSPVLASQWWVPGGTRKLPAYAWFKNPTGASAIVNATGAVDTDGHPFFVAKGGNGRACVSCHQPADGMSVSLTTIQSRWTTTGGRDPLFAMVDGANCPGLPAQSPASHSLLLEKGLFRVALPWPARTSDGQAIATEFQLEVIADPTGCNRVGPVGQSEATAQVSVFRRPRIAANLASLESQHALPGTHLISDGRAPTLVAQMNDAAMHHLETDGALSVADQRAIRAFERQIAVGQVWHATGGVLNEGGASAGPSGWNVDANVLVAAPHSPFPEFEGWLTTRSLKQGIGEWPLAFPPAHRSEEASESTAVRAYRDSVAHGYALFIARPFVGDDGRPQTCATCHNGLHTGSDVTGNHPGLGVAASPGGLPADDLPLFRATCREGASLPHGGRVLYTHDPGRALITGRCADLGEVNSQQLRALAARPPYFTGGSAPTLRSVVEYYDRRFTIGYSADEIADLVHFLEAL